MHPRRVPKTVSDFWFGKYGHHTHRQIAVELPLPFQAPPEERLLLFPQLHISVTPVTKCWCAWQSPRDFLKFQLPSPGDSDSTGLRWGLKIPIPLKKFLTMVIFAHR